MSKFGTPSKDHKWTALTQIYVDSFSFKFVDGRLVYDIQDLLVKHFDIHFSNLSSNSTYTNIPASFDDISIDAITYHPSEHEYANYYGESSCTFSYPYFNVAFSWPMTESEIQHYTLQQKKDAESKRLRKEQQKKAEQKRKAKAEQVELKRLERQAAALKKKMDADPDFADKIKSILDK